jgi:protein phosphatase/serine/threonine-protein phosphatase Stp1
MTGLRSWALTDPGTVRTLNEDSMLSRPDLGLWVVADGAGGHQSGEVASQAIIAALERLPAPLSGAELLAKVRSTMADVHNALRAEAQRRGRNVMIASTFVSLIIRDGFFACLWAGDSRAYLLRDGALSQLSRDHSLVQELVDAGDIAREDAEQHPQANIITRAIGGGNDDIELDKVIGNIQPGDRYLLCSDGLSKTLSDAEITGLLGAPEGVPPPELLVAAALAQQARDNVTAVVIEVITV